MKYVARVAGREIAVEVREEGERTVVLLDGEPIEADLQPVRGHGAWTLRLGDRTHSVMVARDDGEHRVTVGSRMLRVRVEDEREAAAHAVRGDEADGPLVVRSVMPGIVREVSVAVGDEVGEKQALLVLEAMKMQNEVRSPRAGTVAKVLVEAGTTVAKGAPLVELG